MDVYIIEIYNFEENYSEILKVFEDKDVAKNYVTTTYENIVWIADLTEQASIDNTTGISVNVTNMNDNCCFYLYKFEVILDEMPNK